MSSPSSPSRSGRPLEDSDSIAPVSDDQDRRNPVFDDESGSDLHNAPTANSQSAPIIMSSSEGVPDAPSTSHSLKMQLSELEQLKQSYLRLQEDIKLKTEQLDSLASDVCPPSSRSVWGCQMRPFCMLSVLLGQTKDEVRDVGRCLRQLERIEKGNEVPSFVEHGSTEGKQGGEKRPFILMLLLELGIVVLGSCVVIGIGRSLRREKGVEEGELPVVEPRDSGEEGSGSGSRRSWRRWFTTSTARRHGGDEGVGTHEKTVVCTETEREEEGSDEETETQGEGQRLLLPAQPQPRLYERRGIEEHIQNWGMGVQQGMASDESETEEQEQDPEQGYDSGQDSEPESSVADSIEGVTMEEEIASFRDAFGLVEDMLAAVEQRRR